MTQRRKATDTIRLLDEAVAIERAGGTWTQQHAAAVTGYSVESIRISDCPRHHERTPTVTMRPRLVYLPAEVRAWKAGLLLKAS